MKRLTLLLASLLILTYLWAATTPDYPLIARDKNGYGLVDLSKTGADLNGNLVGVHMTLDSLAVTTSVSLPSTGTVPNHPIAGSHDTNATGENLDDLVGGGDLASTLHYHGTAPAGFTVNGGALTANAGEAVNGGTLSANAGLYVGPASFLTGKAGEHGSPLAYESVFWNCNETGANSAVSDGENRWPGVLTTDSALVNANTVTTTTAVLGTAFNLGGTCGITLPETAGSYVPGALMSAIGAKDFTISFWHKARKTGTGSPEYLISGTNISMQITAAGGYSATVNGTTLTDSDSAYNAGFRHIVIVRSAASYYLYVNGRRAALVGGSSSSVTGTLEFGGSSSVSRGRGVYDEIRLYRCALSYAQVAQMYNGGAGASTLIQNIPFVNYSGEVPGDLTLVGNAKGNIAQQGRVQTEYAHYGFEGTGTGAYLLDETNHFDVPISTYPATPQKKYTLNDFTTTNAKVGSRAFAFNSTKVGYIQALLYPRIVGRNFTQTFWVYCYDDNQYGYYIGYGPGIQMRSFTNSTNNFIRLQLYDSLNTAQSVDLSTTIGVWTHIAVIKDGSVMKVYRDGALVGTYTSASGTYDYAAAAAAVTIGGTATRSDCVIDDWRFYQYALSAGQVSALYNSGSGTNESVMSVTSVGGSLNLPYRTGYVAEVRNGSLSTNKGLLVGCGPLYSAVTGQTDLLTFADGPGNEIGGMIWTDAGDLVTWQVSDANRKGRIRDSDIDVNTVLKANVREFVYKGGSNKSTGFVAQEMQKAYPKAVVEVEVAEVRETSETLGLLVSDNGTTLTLRSGKRVIKSDPNVRIEGTHVVRYGKKTERVKRLGVAQSALIPVLWKTAQNQQKRIDALEARLTTLEKKATP